MSRSRAIDLLLVGLTAFAGLCGAPRDALANGAFPTVSQLVPDPSDPDHLVLRSTFGLLVTRDHGATWDWLCEEGMGYKDVEPPMAVLPGGVILLATPNGIMRSDAAGCDFQPASGVTAMVLDLARIPTDPNGAVAVSLSGTDTQLWRTDDGGMTFAPVGDVVSAFIPATVDVAPTDAGVVYVSGLAGTQGALLRSTDGGVTFATLPVPNTSTSHRPYIAAVDPTDSKTVYVRLDGEPSMVEVTHDGGDTFVAPLMTKVPALGLAVSPDGATVIASNSYDGTFRADAQTLDFEQVACGGPSCLSFSASGLFGCGDQGVDGFIVGRSDDLGASFQRVVDLTCIRGPAACGSDTSIGSACPDAWPAVRDQIGASECAPPDVEPYTGCFGAAGEGNAGSGTSSNGGTAATGGSGTKAGGGGNAGGGTPAPSSTPATKSGGGCAVRAPARAPDEAAWALAFAVAAFVRRRSARAGRSA
ncbi:MAG TPA: hypothetical protein VMI54_14355 [Polyangiaceae bacterium]|nr:hypothetical protein [Polyangiaceae bacterium]